MNLAYREYLDDNVALADELLDGCPADLREWEWDYAQRLGHSELKTLPGLEPGSRRLVGGVLTRRLAAGLRLGPWGFRGRESNRRADRPRRPHRRRVFALRGLTGAVQAVAFSPDGHRLAAAWGFDRQGTSEAVLAVFDIPSGRKVWERPETRHADPQPGVLSRRPLDRQRLRMVQRIRRRSVSPGCGTPRPASRSASRSPADPAACSAWRFLPTAASSLWPAATSPTSATCRARAGRSSTSCAGMSTSSMRSPFLRTAGAWPPAAGTRPSGSGTVTTAHICKRLIGHRGFVRGLAFSADGTQLVSGSEDKSVRRWDLAGGGENAAFHGHTGFVHCVAFGPTALWPHREARTAPSSSGRRRPRHPGDVPQQRRLGRHRGPGARRPPRRLGP